MTPKGPVDPVLAALDNLEESLRRAVERGRIAKTRADEIISLRNSGRTYRDIVPMEQRPLIVELLTQTLEDLADASSQFRRAEARALYSEGLTMAEIADLFGVSRQRVAALLNSADGEGDASSNHRKGTSGVTAAFPCLTDLIELVEPFVALA